jgi:hypothetical protein
LEALLIVVVVGCCDDPEDLPMLEVHFRYDMRHLEADALELALPTRTGDEDERLALEMIAAVLRDVSEALFKPDGPIRSRAPNQFTCAVTVRTLTEAEAAERERRLEVIGHDENGLDTTVEELSLEMRLARTRAAFNKVKKRVPKVSRAKKAV